MGDQEFESDLEPMIRGEITRLRAALKFGNFHEKSEALHELIKLKGHARPLVPLIREAFYLQEHWVPMSSLVGLLEATQDTSLLKALQQSGRLHELGIGDKVICFCHGAYELEGDLIQFLYENRKSPETPWRSDVADSLGKLGGRESLYAIKAIVTELSELDALPSEQGANAPNSILKIERGAQLQFREKLRGAIRCLAERNVDQQPN